MDEKMLIDELIVAIVEEKEDLECIINKEEFEDAQILLTALYLCMRYCNPIKYMVVIEKLHKLQKEGKGNGREEETRALIQDIVRYDGEGQHTSANTIEEHVELSQNYNSIQDMITSESKLYKTVMLKVLEFSILILEEQMVAILVTDIQITIHDRLLALLLKHHYYSAVKLIITNNIPIYTLDSIDNKIAYPPFKLFGTLELGTYQIKKHIKPGDIVDFMIKYKFEDIDLLNLIHECSDLKDQNVVFTLLSHQYEKLTERLIREKYTHTDEVVLKGIDFKCFSFLLFYLKISNFELMEYQNEIIEQILKQMEKDSQHIQIYLYLLYKYLKYITLLDAKNFLTYIENSLHGNEAFIQFLYGQANPIKILILLLEIVQMLGKMYNSLKIKVGRSKKELIQLIKHIQAQIDNENEMRQIFYDKDIDNRELMFIIGINDFIELLEDKNMQIIINDIWIGPYILGSDFLSATSSLCSLFMVGGNGKRDIELHTRKRLFVKDVQQMKSHSLQFYSWKDGIQARYMFEFLIFLFMFGMNFYSATTLTHYSRKFMNLENFDLRNPEHKSILEEMLHYDAISLQIQDALIVLFNLLLIHYIYTILFVLLAKRLFSIKIFLQVEFIIDFMACFLAGVMTYLYDKETQAFLESHRNNDPLLVQLQYLSSLMQKEGYQLSIGFLLLVNVIRLFITFRVNSIFGPLIKMIQLMIKAMVVFLVMYFINLLTFSVIATILMFPSSNGRYSSTYESFITLFQASLGVLTFDDLDEEIADESTPIVKDIFLVIFLGITLVLLMNFLIAILSNIYSIYETRGSSLYMIEIVRLRNIHASDECFGCLISSPNPISICVNTIPLILYLFTTFLHKPKKINKTINYVFLYIQFLLIFLLELVVYLGLNGLLFPFVYIKWVFRKIALISKGTEGTKRSRVTECFIFLIFGVLILFINYLTDAYYFCIHSFLNRPQHISSTKKIDYIPRTIYLKLLEFLARNREKHILVTFDQIMNQLQEICNIEDIKFLKGGGERGPVNFVSEKKLSSGKQKYLFNRKASIMSPRMGGVISGQRKNRIIPIFEGEEKLERKEQEARMESILTYASISKIVENLSIINKDGVKIVSLDLFHTVLYTHIRMEELRARSKLLIKLTQEELIRKQSTLRSLSSKSSSLNGGEKIADLEDNSDAANFLRNNILMTLLHSYKLEELNKGVTFYKAEGDQPIRIDSLLNKMDNLLLLMGKMLTTSKLQEGNLERIKLENNMSFEDEIEGVSVFDNISWVPPTDQSQVFQTKTPKLAKFSESDLDSQFSLGGEGGIENQVETSQMKYIGEDRSELFSRCGIKENSNLQEADVEEGEEEIQMGKIIETIQKMNTMKSGNPNQEEKSDSEDEDY